MQLYIISTTTHDRYSKNNTCNQRSRKYTENIIHNYSTNQSIYKNILYTLN